MSTTSALLALFERNPAPPIDEAALLLAADFTPALDIPATRAALDALAAPLVPRLEHVRTARDIAAVLATWLFDEQNFQGDEATYYDPRNSYLHEVLKRRKGIPITLAVVMIAVGRRAGVCVEGVGFPGHFLARVHGAHGDDGVLVDPFFQGREVTRAALDALAFRMLGNPSRLRPEHLATVDARAMVTRMLVNLHSAHEGRGDHANALLACDRLLDLTGNLDVRRDRARHLLALGASEAAAADLEAWLRARPHAPEAGAVRELLARIRRVRRDLQ